MKTEKLNRCIILLHLQQDMSDECKLVVEYNTMSDAPGPYSGPHFFSSFDEAYAAYQADRNIWKISWENYRWRPKFKSKQDTWALASEEKLCSLSKAYADEQDPTALYWVNQSAFVPVYWTDNYLDLSIRRKGVRKHMREQKRKQNLDRIRDILTDAEFRARFGKQPEQKE